jgi:hypothetical protein
LQRQTTNSDSAGTRVESVRHSNVGVSGGGWPGGCDDLQEEMRKVIMAKLYLATVNFGDDATGTHEKTTNSLAFIRSHYEERFPGVVFEKGSGNTYTMKLGTVTIGTVAPEQ